MAKQLTLAVEKVPAHISMSVSRGNENVDVSTLSVPRIKQLQKMSDEVDKHHPKYVQGAEAGMFINSLSNELLGEKLYLINIKFHTKFVVWRTREAGGGLIDACSTLKEAQDLIAVQEDKPENFQIQETHSHTVMMKNPETGELSMPAIFDFAASKLFISKNWNTQIKSKGGHRFSYVWTVKSVKTTNKKNQTWHIFETDMLRSDAGNPMYTPEKLVEDISAMVSDPNFSF